MRLWVLPQRFRSAWISSCRRLKKEKHHFGCASRRALYALREIRPIRCIAGLRLVTKVLSCAVAKKKTPTSNTTEGVKATGCRSIRGPQITELDYRAHLEGKGR